MSFAPKCCLTAHASTNSGATIIQNINSNRFHRAFHLFCGGTFGCTEVQAHIITVETQLQTTPDNVRFDGDIKSCSVSRAVVLSMSIGVALTAL